jgi:hypothetical protein
MDEVSRVSKFGTDFGTDERSSRRTIAGELALLLQHVLHVSMCDLGIDACFLSIRCALDTPVSLAVDSDVVLPRVAKPRVTILAIPEMVLQFRGNFRVHL